MAPTTLRPKTLLTALAALTLAAAACKHGGGGEARNADPSQVVAKVDDTVITVADVQERINKQSPFVRARYTSADKKKEFVDTLVRFEVMAAEAARRGYDKDPDVQRVMKQQMISKLMQKDFESKLKVEDVPEADVEKYYNEHPAEFHQKDEVRVSAIFLKDKAKADKVYAEARALPKGPASFGDQKGFRDLVAKYSEDEESKPRGGDLSFFAADTQTVPKPIVDAAFALKEVGDTAAPVKTDKGWAIVRLTQKRPGFNRPLPEVKRQIQQRLFRDLRSKAMDAFVDDLKKKSNITINDDNLAKVVVEGGAGRAPGTGIPGAELPPTAAPPPGTPAPRPVGMQPVGAPQAPTHP
ncbi:MAG TPA: peptidyl-prolyl cis-trans isomerase [Polyangia bacterium]|nr:peptidyl-prolyl cis-trans isomerase [Polyangia bacterium]